MKKRIIALLLCLALLPFGSVLAAGTAEDPLISLSYIKDTFLPRLYSALGSLRSETVEKTLEETKSSGNMEKSRLPSGSSVRLSQGQSFVLLSGSARLESGSGAVADVSSGTELSSGTLTEGHRYIVCGSSARLSTDSLSQMLLSPNALTSIPEEQALVSPFEDVTPEFWYHNDVVRAYNRGLVNGITATVFKPQGNLSIAQAIKLAACMHQLYHDGSVSLANSATGLWYESYIEYALDAGIIPESFPEYNVSITRQQFIEIFYAALPTSEYEAINTIPYGSIGDLSTGSDWVEKVYAFYRAGILTGYTAGSKYNAHDFGPESFITRAEVAAIMERMFNHSARVYFEID